MSISAQGKVIERVAVVDVETTGLNPRVHEVIEVGCIFFEQEREGGLIHSINVKDEREWKIKPARLSDADPYALAINGYNKDAWSDAPDRKETLRELSKLLTYYPKDLQAQASGQYINQCIVLGHNVHFDLAMLEQAFAREKVEHRWNKYVLDTHSIARRHFTGDQKMRSYSLGALCERFGIVNSRAHTALSDCRATLEVYKRLMGVS